MKIHRFIGNFDLIQGNFLLTEKLLVHQINRVLKLKIGEEIILGNGKGIESKGKITQLGENVIRVYLDDIVVNSNDPTRTVRLYCALLKRENFELVVQKAVELGVSEIIPLVTERTIKTQLNQERLKRIIHEATEQSERGKIPHLSEPVAFKEAVKNIDGPSFFLDRSGQDLKTITKVAERSVNIFIGPEGGWTDAEIALAQSQGLQPISIGRTILRAESAAIVGCFWVVSLLS